MAEAVSRRPLTVEAWVWTQASTYGICVGQSSTVTGFSPNNAVLPCHYYKPAGRGFDYLWCHCNFSVK